MYLTVYFSPLDCTPIYNTVHLIWKTIRKRDKIKTIITDRQKTARPT